MKCDNLKCISNHEAIDTKFNRVKDSETTKYKCYYCERIISEEEIKLKTK